ncbi:hypothetical protein [Streptomyces deserti]
MLLQTVSRGDNLTLADQLRTWAEELRIAGRTNRRHTVVGPVAAPGP